MPRDYAELYKDLRLVNSIVSSLKVRRFKCAVAMHTVCGCSANMHSRGHGTHVERGWVEPHF